LVEPGWNVFEREGAEHSSPAVEKRPPGKLLEQWKHGIRGLNRLRNARLASIAPI